MFIDYQFETTRNARPEMNILKIVRGDTYICLTFKECSQGLKTTLDHMVCTLDRIGFTYFQSYCEDIKKQIDKGERAFSGANGGYLVACHYDSENHISLFSIHLDGGLK